MFHLKFGINLRIVGLNYTSVPEMDKQIKFLNCYRRSWMQIEREWLRFGVSIFECTLKQRIRLRSKLFCRSRSGFAYYTFTMLLFSIIKLIIIKYFYIQKIIIYYWSLFIQFIFSAICVKLKILRLKSLFCLCRII